MPGITAFLYGRQEFLNCLFAFPYDNIVNPGRQGLKTILVAGEVLPPGYISALLKGPNEGVTCRIFSAQV